MSKQPLVNVPADPSKPFILKMSPRDALSYMPRDLREDILELKAKAERVVHGQTECVHDLGRVLAEKLGGGRAAYGHKSVYWSAAALGASLTHVYRAIDFYETFPDLDAVLDYVRRGADAGYDFTITHLQEVAKEDDSYKRAELIEACLDGQLSTRALAKLMRARDKERAPDGPNLALPRNLKGAVTNIGGTTKNLLEELGRVVPGDLLPRLAALNVERTRPDEFDQITAMIGGMEELAVTLSEYAGQIADCLARVRGAGGGDAGDADGGEAESAEHEELDAPEAPQAEVEDDAMIDSDEADGPAPPEQSVKKKRGRPHEIVVD